ncbi:MAG: uncharacterized protein C75L2_00450033 [Leptospirillum sp. Group II 'C75']|nr:MAG: uncharacterized protein C75L2_00450033 [Leptospirillum sp. Group II 'C75']
MNVWVRPPPKLMGRTFGNLSTTALSWGALKRSGIRRIRLGIRPDRSVVFSQKRQKRNFIDKFCLMKNKSGDFWKRATLSDRGSEEARGRFPGGRDRPPGVLVILFSGHPSGWHIRCFSSRHRSFFYLSDGFSSGQEARDGAGFKDASPRRDGECF